MEQLSDYSIKSIRKWKNIYELSSASFQGARTLFVLAYVIAANAVDDEADIKGSKKYFLPRGEIDNYDALIDARHFYDKPINDLIKQYDEVGKLSTGQGDDYTTGCLLDYTYFKDNYRLIAIDLSNQKALHPNPRAIQQIVLQGVVGGADGTKIRIYTQNKNKIKNKQC